MFGNFTLSFMAKICWIDWVRELNNWKTVHQSRFNGNDSLELRLNWDLWGFKEYKEYKDYKVNCEGEVMKWWSHQITPFVWDSIGIESYVLRNTESIPVQKFLVLNSSIRTKSVSLEPTTTKYLLRRKTSRSYWLHVSKSYRSRGPQSSRSNLSSRFQLVLNQLAMDWIQDSSLPFTLSRYQRQEILR